MVPQSLPWCRGTSSTTWIAAGLGVYCVATDPSAENNGIPASSDAQSRHAARQGGIDSGPVAPSVGGPLPLAVATAEPIRRPDVREVERIGTLQ